jgi:hypothetical protein
MIDNEEDRAVRLGDLAEALLQSEPFLTTITDLDQRYYKAWLTSPAAQTGDREFLHAKARALQDIVAELAQRVAVRDQIYNRREAENFSEDDI